MNDCKTFATSRNQLLYTRAHLGYIGLVSARAYDYVTTEPIYAMWHSCLCHLGSHNANTVEPPNKGHFGSRAFVFLFGGCPLVGGSFKLLFIAISKTYRMYGLYISFLVQEAKELAEIIDIYADRRSMLKS